MTPKIAQEISRAEAQIAQWRSMAKDGKQRLARMKKMAAKDEWSLREEVEYSSHVSWFKS